jgi:aryl-alcohol dehydrogenase-like predicted oxidoreductase
VQVITQSLTIGRSPLRVSPLGVGTWQWGDVRYWGYGRDYAHDEVAAAYRASRQAGINFFDTAEIYGSGMSERNLGELVRADAEPVIVATKFAPLPGRWTARSVAKACEASLQRLGMPSVDLYQIHWPYGLISIEALMNALADLVAAGKVRAVGVSNFSAPQMERAYRALDRRGVPLTSNQVHYSLLHRKPERNGVLKACRELGVTLIAYSPLEQGVLTGKFHEGAQIQSVMRRRLSGFSPARLRAAQPLIAALRDIGNAHGGKTPAQVALNWLMSQGVLPIPGAKNAQQATANADALGWQLTEAEFERLASTANP